MDVEPGLFQENERTAPAVDERKYLSVGELTCECGFCLPEVVVAYETWGTLNEDKSNAIVICHALSGDSHAIGWWDRIVGPGLAIDTDKYFVVGTNSLGGCQGTTGPTTLAPDGSKWGSRFPQVTVGDMVEVQIRLMRALGISQLHGVAGGSMGGMQALEWTMREPGLVRKCWMTASCAQHSAMQIGYNEAARQAILRDPKSGLAVARMIGHLSYLSEFSFEKKFGRSWQEAETKQFAVESYLNYQGDKFTQRFDAASFVVLSRAIDLYSRTDLDGSQSDYLFTSFTSDILYPSHQSQFAHELALKAGRPSAHHVIDLPFGHDTFLLDGQVQAVYARQFLESA